MEMKQKAPAVSAGATARKSQSITKRKTSPQQEQYFKVIHMSSAELGAALKAPTDRIDQHVRKASDHDAEAKKERAEARREFQENIGFYYEAKQRLRNPGYRTDVDGGKERTPADNEKYFGAQNWAAFNEKCAAFSLQHADRMLKAFAKVNGLLTDEGENIDDPEPEDDEGAGRPQGRRAKDPTAQKRYEFIAAAAMEIANRNPEGAVEKQILAAAEHAPSPLMPVPPDLFSEVLSFLTGISSSDTVGANIRGEAKQLVNKMRLHQPAPAGAEVPAEVAKEEKRKRDKRLAKKNGQPLGAPASDPPTETTTEHVQELESMPAAASLDSGTGALPSQGSKTSTKARTAEPIPGPEAQPQIVMVGGRRQGPFVLNDKGKYEYEPENEMREAFDDKGAAVSGCEGLNAPPVANIGGSSLGPQQAKVTACPPGVNHAGGGREHETLDAANVQGAGRVAAGRGDAAAKKGSEEYKRRKSRQQRECYHRKKKKTKVQADTPSAGAAVPATTIPGGKAPAALPAGSISAPDMRKADQDLSTHHWGQRPRRAEPGGQTTTSYQVKPRSKPGFPTDYPIVREGDKQPFDVFNTKQEADAACEKLNNRPVTLPQDASPQSASHAAA